MAGWQGKCYNNQGMVYNLLEGVQRIDYTKKNQHKYNVLKMTVPRSWKMKTNSLNKSILAGSQPKNVCQLSVKF